VFAPTQQTAPPPEVTSYYYFGGKRVAMRKGAAVMWLHSDHLGNASLATDLSGNPVPGSETRYKPFGEIRFGSSGLPTDRRFTGYARERANYVGSLDFAQARYYSPLLGRFLSADTIVPRPDDPQAFNRYSYSRNSPLSRIDPTGHADCDPDDATCLLGLPSEAKQKDMAERIKKQARPRPSNWLIDLLRGLLPSFNITTPSLTQWGYISEQQGFKVTTSVEGISQAIVKDFKMYASYEGGKLTVGEIGFTIGGIEYSAGPDSAAIEVPLPLSGEITIGEQKFARSITLGREIFEPEMRFAAYRGIAQSGTLPTDSPFYELSVKVDVKIFDLPKPMTTQALGDNPPQSSGAPRPGSR